MEKGRRPSSFSRVIDYILEKMQKMPNMFIPMTYTSDMTGAAAQLCGVEDFIMWTMEEERSAHTLVKKFTETAVNGAEVMAEKYSMAMIATGSVLGNNDILSDQAVNDYSIRYLQDFVRGAMNKGAGPQLFYHLCGNHETDYNLLKDRLVWSPFTIMHVGYRGREVFQSDLLVEEFGNMGTVMGSVDTKIMAMSNPKAVYEQAKDQVCKGRDAPCGLGTTCEVPLYSPPENIQALVQASKYFGTYGTW